MTIELYKTIDRIVDDYNISLPELYKRRDPKEPGRAEKEMFEDKLSGLVKRRFRAQKKIIAESLRWSLPHKQIDSWMARIPDLTDPETEKRIMSLFIGAMDHGGQLFGETVTFDLNWDQYHEDASNWVREFMYTGKVDPTLANGWLAALDETTMNGLRQQLQNFVEIEGYTIGDVMAGLPFDESRVQRIATTEITRIYGQAELLAGQQLEAEFPDVPVVKTWFTNNDDLVCVICGPMNEQTVGLGSMFVGGLGGTYDAPPAHINCRCWMSTRTDIDA